MPCLRRMLTLFLAFALASALPGRQADVSPSATTQPLPLSDPASSAPSGTATKPEYSIRATTMYVISESFTYDPTTFSTTTIYETILPTTRTTHAPDGQVGFGTETSDAAGTDGSASGTASGSGGRVTPSSPFAAVATTQSNTSGAGRRVVGLGGGLVGAALGLMAFFL